MQVEVIQFRGGLKAVNRLLKTIYHNDAPVVIRELNMNWLIGFARAKESASRLQIVIIEMPDGGRPRIVQHPLNHSCRRVLVPPISLKHCALAVIRHCLCLPQIVRQIGSLAVSRVHGIVEDVQVFEFLAASVIVPHVIDRPKVVFAQHLCE